MLNYRRHEIERAAEVIDMPNRLDSSCTYSLEPSKKVQLNYIGIQTSALLADWLELETKLTKLREAVAAVVEAWDEGCWQITGWNHQQDIDEMELRIDALRQAAGIKAPPQDGDDDDERKEE